MTQIKPARNLAVALALVASVPAMAAAQQTVWGGATYGQTSCSGATLTPCVQFELNFNETDNVWEFTTWYLGSTSSDPGVLTATGLYDPNKNADPSFDFGSITGVYPTTGWNVTDCSHLSGDGPSVFEACSDGDGGVGNGILPGDSVVFTFTYTGTRDLEADLANGVLGARAHIQSFGSADCSLKPDSRVGVVSGPEGGLETCNGEVVPEPATILLLATGLIGVGAVGYRSRRKEGEQA